MDCICIGLHLSASARVQGFNESIYLLDATELHVIDLSGSQPLARSVPLVDPLLKDATTIQFWPTNGTVVTVLPDREVVQIDVNTGLHLLLPAASQQHLNIHSCVVEPIVSCLQVRPAASSHSPLAMTVPSSAPPLSTTCISWAVSPKCTSSISPPKNLKAPQCGQ